MTRTERMRKIVAEHAAAKVDGVTVDAFSASAFVAVYDAAPEVMQGVMETAPLHRVMTAVWKCVK